MPDEEEGEPTYVCPNCGALVPVGAPNCFICDAEMPKEVPAKAEEAKPSEPAPEELPPSEPVEVTVPEVAPKTEPEKVEAAIEKVPGVSPPPVMVITEAPPPKTKKTRAEKAKVIALKPAIELPSVPEVKETAPARTPVPEEAAREFPPPQEEGVLSPAKEPSAADAAKVEEVKAGPPAQVAGPEKKAAKLKAAFEAGKIPRDVYVENLAALGISIALEVETTSGEEETASVLPSAEQKVKQPSIREEIPSDVSAVEAEETVREEAPPETVEEETATEERVSKAEIVEEVRRSYRGVAMASAGGLMYALTILIFISMFGNAISALILALGAVLIVAGGNVAARDFASAAAKARTFSCPLCSERLDISATECPNCGAKFSD